MSFMDLFDDVGGALDILDQIETWVSFALAPKSRRARRFGRLDLVEIRIPRNDKMMERGIDAPTLNETMQYLRNFGVHSKACGFSSTHMHFKVRKSQEKWARRLLQLDEDGIPQLDYSRQSWQDKRHARKRSAKQSTLGKLAKEIFG